MRYLIFTAMLAVGAAHAAAGPTPDVSKQYEACKLRIAEFESGDLSEIEKLYTLAPEAVVALCRFQIELYEAELATEAEGGPATTQPRQ